MTILFYITILLNKTIYCFCYSVHSVNNKSLYDTNSLCSPQKCTFKHYITMQCMTSIYFTDVQVVYIKNNSQWLFQFLCFLTTDLLGKQKEKILSVQL